MAEIDVTFDDGAMSDMPAGTTAGDALRAHAERTARGARGAQARPVAARVEAGGGARRRSISAAPLAEDCRVSRRRAPTRPTGSRCCATRRAHLMAQAVKRLFPDAQITIGPVIENGFYYDFKRAQPFTPEDLERIEATMREIVKREPPGDAARRCRATRRSRCSASMGEHYKVEIIEGIPEDVVSLYRQGEFVDLCRGPHVPSTGRIKAFKLTSVAGAYWRGDERNEMLQRIYGTAFAEPEGARGAPASASRRRSSATTAGSASELDLFSLHPIAPGSPVLPSRRARSSTTRWSQYMRSLYGRYGYTEVITPLIYKTRAVEDARATTTPSATTCSS